MAGRAAHKPVGSPPRRIAAGEFKTHCLRLMDEVAEQHVEITITKYGKPVAKLVPAVEEVADSFGALKGSIRYVEDIVSPDHGAWRDGHV
jgi:prevent-host-death family protein